MDQIQNSTQIQHSSLTTNCSASVWNQKVDPICYCVAVQCLMPGDIDNVNVNDIDKCICINLKGFGGRGQPLKFDRNKTSWP